MLKEEDLKTVQESLDKVRRTFTDGFSPQDYFNIFANLGVLKRSYVVDMDNDGLDILDSTGSPIVFAYEQVNSKIYILWDACHFSSIIEFGLNDLSKQVFGESFSEAFRVPPPQRPLMFAKTLNDLNRDNGPIVHLALELTCNRGQQILDAYVADELDYKQAGAMLIDDHMSVGLDNYGLLLLTAHTEKIKIHAIDSPASLHDDLTGNYTQDEKIYKREHEYMAPNLKKLSSDGKTMAIIGAGHRKNLLELLK